MNTIEADEVQVLGKERRWGFWNSRVISDGVTVYMRRISILTTPWFSIKLHRIYRADQQRELHDHPWNFFSIVLWGIYVEDTIEGERPCSLWNWKRAEDRHSIRSIYGGPVWTLVFCGRPRRVWGFWVDGGTRFVRWNEYEKLNEA